MLQMRVANFDLDLLAKERATARANWLLENTKLSKLDTHN